MIAPQTTSKAQSNDDSDSDWDDDDDFATKKINIKIRPIAQVTPGKISASVDELRATVGTWKSLANVNLVKPNSRRHHQSTLQLNNIAITDQTTVPQIATTSSVIFPDDLVLSEEPLGVRPNSNSDNSQTNGTNHHVPVNQIIDLDVSMPKRSLPDMEGFGGPYSNKLSAHKLAPNDLLNPLNSSILSPKTVPDLKRASADDRSATKIPVAFVVQECLNAMLHKSKEGGGRASLIGRVKMAVPTNILYMANSVLESDLEITVVCSTSWDKFRVNQEFVREREGNGNAQPFVTSNSMRKFSVDMKAVRAFVQKQYVHHSSAKYFILPALLEYLIGSQDKEQEITDTCELARVSPLHALAHWLCDLNITKVRVDVKFLETIPSDIGISSDDIKNLKISMHVNGDVTSYQSKPDANWNPLESKLTWSFANLTELISKSTSNAVTSCLARFDLNDGPSTPGDVSIQFSISGKTISGSCVILDSTRHHRITVQTLQVKTGDFRCEPPCA